MNLEIPQSNRLIPSLLRLALIAGTGSVTSYWFLDGAVQQYTASLGFRGDIAALLTFIGFLGHGVFCLFVAVSIWFLDSANRKAILLIVASVLMAGGFTSGVKTMVYRPRPAIVAGLEANVTDSIFNQAEFQSFPSGHTTTAFALATAMAIVYPHGILYFFSLAALVGLQRVLTQAHYPSDVFAGAMIGLLVATFLSRLLLNGTFIGSIRTPANY